MVDVARYFTKFLEEESAANAPLADEGVRRMKEVLTEHHRRAGTEESIPLLEELGDAWPWVRSAPSGARRDPGFRRFAISETSTRPTSKRSGAAGNHGTDQVTPFWRTR